MFLVKRLFLVDFDCFLQRWASAFPGEIVFGGKVIVFG
jgi:hypothetical protein